VAEAQGTIASFQRQAADLDAQIHQRDAAAATQHAQAAERIQLLEQQIQMQLAVEAQKADENLRYQEKLIRDAEQYKVQVSETEQEMEQMQAQWYEAVSPTIRQTEPSPSVGGTATWDNSNAGGGPQADTTNGRKRFRAAPQTSWGEPRAKPTWERSGQHKGGAHSQCVELPRMETNCQKEGSRSIG
jgi:seryl-tRNA synthetase